jgi:hypothetical protein
VDNDDAIVEARLGSREAVEWSVVEDSRVSEVFVR